MIWIKTNRFPLPPKGVLAITLWPFCFYRGEFTEADRNHERIHQRQYLVCVLVGLFLFAVKYSFGWKLNWLFIPLPFLLFYIIYGITALIKGYKNMNWERNANMNEK